ncbi:MAG: class I SAM-dependent methyltransferase [Bacteroidia bacterium]
MKNLGLLFPFLRLCFTNTSEVLKNLYNFTVVTDSKNRVIKKHKLPKGLPTIDLLDLFPALHESIENYTFLEGTSRITDIVILKMLARRFEKARYLEFGTWRGESISNVAQVAQECYSISFSEQEMRAFGIDESSIKVSRIFSRNIPNVKHIEHNSQTYDFSKLEKSFDLVFVDADHKYEGVRIDTSNAFKLLKNEKSILVWHDIGKGLEELNNWEVLAGILDGAPSDEHRKNIYRISNSLCAIYINEKVKSSYPEHFVPNKTFSIQLTAHKLS